MGQGVRPLYGKRAAPAGPGAVAYNPCPMTPAISFQQVGKTFQTPRGPLQALDGVSLDIAQGEFFGLLGPNGAGKTTLISIICGIVNGSDGSVTVDGHDIVRDFRAARGLPPPAQGTVWTYGPSSTRSLARGSPATPPVSGADCSQGAQPARLVGSSAVPSRRALAVAGTHFPGAVAAAGQRGKGKQSLLRGANR